MIKSKFASSQIDQDSFGTLPPGRYLSEWPQHVYHLKNVFIGHNGAILNENKMLIPEVNFNYYFWRWIMNKKDFPDRINNPQQCSSFDSEKIGADDSNIIRLDPNTNYVYGHHYFNAYVFGHLWDSFQDFRKIEALNLKKTCLIMPKITKHVNNLDYHLNLFGYPKEKRLNIDLSEKLKNILYVPNLYYSSPTSYPSSVSKSGLDYLRSKYYKTYKGNAQKTKLYLKRPENKRSVINNNEIEEYLSSIGFTIIDGTEGIKKHVSLFKKASFIVGAHGSLFRNIIFCNTDVVVYEFCPENRQDHNFEGIGKTMGIKYNWIKTKADDNFNSFIDLNFIKNLNFND